MAEALAKIGGYFHEEIAAPLELDFYIGLPEDIPLTRIATIKRIRPWQLLFNLNTMPWPFLKAMFNSRNITARTFANPAVISTIVRDKIVYPQSPIKIQLNNDQTSGRSRNVSRSLPAWSAI